MVLSLERWLGKVAVVTGASSGIGKAIAEQLVEKGLKVVGLARRKERLDELERKLAGKKGKFYGHRTDLSKEEDIVEAFEWIKKNVGPVHILINNAATLGGGDLLDGASDVWKRIFQVNVIGLSVATREAVKVMKANNIDGHIVHINSIVGHQVIKFPDLSVYPASKFAVTALAETLRLELNSIKAKIKITSVSPGVVDTEIIPEALRNSEKFKTMVVLQPEDIADGVVYALSTPPHVQIQELTIRPIIENH